MKERVEIVGDIEKLAQDFSQKIRKNKGEFQKNKIKYIITKFPNGSERIHSKEYENEFSEAINVFTYNGELKRGIFSNTKNRSSVNKSAIDISELIYKCVFETENIEKLEKIYNQKKEKKQFIEISVSLYFFVDLIPEWKNHKVREILLYMNNSFAMEFFEGLIQYVKVELSSDISEYEKEILRLETEKNRANNLIAKLQDEFDDRLEEGRREEQEKLLQELNSSRYDFILDKAVALQNGLKQLRREHIIVPLQINSVSSLVREVIQFAEDCGITPMMELGDEFEISGIETEYYQYSGSPFSDASQRKMVVVTSTGWEIKDKNIIISQPTVKEIEPSAIEMSEKTNESSNNEPDKVVQSLENGKKPKCEKKESSKVSVVRNRRSMLERIGDFVIAKCEKGGMCEIAVVEASFNAISSRDIKSKLKILQNGKMLEMEEENIRWVASLEEWKRFLDRYNKNINAKRDSKPIKKQKMEAKDE